MIDQTPIRPTGLATPPEKWDEVRRLFAEGLTGRQVAALAGVSLRTAQRIKNGKLIRGGSPRGPKPITERGDIKLPGSKTGRCPTCGHRVYLPCLACQVGGR